MIPESFTYYRSKKERRVWLVADIDRLGLFNDGAGYVLLLEWGKGKENFVKISLAAWSQLIATGRMELFTPTYEGNA